MKKKILTMIMTAVVSLSVFAVIPENKGERELSTAERKAALEKEVIENAAIMKEVLESRQWVLEADRLRDRYGNSGFVDSDINFVSVTGDNAVIQLRVTNEMGVLHGAGGITIEGKVSKYEVKKDRKDGRGVSLKLSVKESKPGHSTIHFHFRPDGKATAKVSTKTGGKLIYDGTVFPLNESDAYKAITTL